MLEVVSKHRYLSLLVCVMIHAKHLSPASTKRRFLLNPVHLDGVVGRWEYIEVADAKIPKHLVVKQTA